MNPVRLLTTFAILAIVSSISAVRVYNVGGRVKAPVVVSNPPIDYSSCDLEGKRLSGYPIVDAVVDARGRVVGAKLTRRVEPCIDRQVLANLREWKYRPGTLDGKPVAVRVHFVVHIHYR